MNDGTLIKEKTRRKKKITGIQLIAICAKYFVLILGATLSILPLLVVFIGSFKSNADFVSSGVLELPKEIDYSSYKTAFVNGKMLLGFRNTAFIFIVSMAGKLLLGAMFAYAVNRFQFRFKKVMMALFLLATLIPAITNQVATFQIINSLGLFNTVWSVIILNIGTDVMSLYIFLQYLDEIPISLDESALIDGATYVQIFRKIILPNLKAPMVTVLIVRGVAIYNDFYNPFLYMPKGTLKVISTALFAFKGPYGSNWPVILAGVVIVVVPILILFIALQKYIYNGMMGSVK